MCVCERRVLAEGEGLAEQRPNVSMRAALLGAPEGLQYLTALVDDAKAKRNLAPEEARESDAELRRLLAASWL